MTQKPDVSYDWSVFLDDQDPPVIFHGTNSLLVPQILEEGMNISQRFYNPAVIEILSSFERELDASDIGQGSIWDDIYLTGNYAVGASYAQTAPECARFIQNSLEYMLKKQSESLTPGERSLLRAEHKKIMVLRSQGEPALLYVKTDMKKFGLSSLFTDREMYEEIKSRFPAQKSDREMDHKEHFNYIRSAKGREQRIRVILMKLAGHKRTCSSFQEAMELKFRGTPRKAGSWMELKTKEPIPPEDIVYVEYNVHPEPLFGQYN